MKNSIFSRLAKLCSIALFTLFVLTLTGCPKPVDEPVNPVTPGKSDPVKTPETPAPEALAEDSILIGSWTSTYYENFIVTKDTFESAGTYKGDSLVVLKASETAGTIFVKYTFVPDWTKGQKEKPEDTTGWTESWGSWYPQNEALIGKWYAVNYKNLTAESVSISGAYKADGKSAAETLEEAVTEFTIENGYFGEYSECAKDAE